jgi:hypothetical protein
MTIITPAVAISRPLTVELLMDSLLPYLRNANEILGEAWDDLEAQLGRCIEFRNISALEYREVLRTLKDAGWKISVESVNPGHAKERRDIALRVAPPESSLIGKKRQFQGDRKPNPYATAEFRHVDDSPPEDVFAGELRGFAERWKSAEV